MRQHEYFLFTKILGRIRMLEIRNKKLIIDGYVIGDEERLLSIFDKANKYDELKAKTNFGKEASQ